MLTTKSKLIQWFAITLILEIGLLHLFTAQAEYEEVAYMGYLFVANFLGALIAAVGIYRRLFLGWILGVFIAIGSIAGYAWSRTLGMPGMEVEEWFNPIGIVVMLLEGGFCILFLFRPWKIKTDEKIPATSSKLRYLMPVAGLLVIASVSVLTFRWDAAFTLAFGTHVGSLDQLNKTPVTFNSDLEEKYGVQVLQAATSMMGSIIDVRIRIVDPDKAHAFLQNQAAMLLDQQALILAPHMHSHAGSRLKTGKVFVVFFPTQQIIHTGSEVSLVFGPVRTEAMVVK
jgi:hypothetical protein